MARKKVQSNYEAQTSIYQKDLDVKNSNFEERRRISLSTPSEDGVSTESKSIFKNNALGVISPTTIQDNSLWTFISSLSHREGSPSGKSPVKRRSMRLLTEREKERERRGRERRGARTGNDLEYQEGRGSLAFHNPAITRCVLPKSLIVV